MGRRSTRSWRSSPRWTHRRRGARRTSRCGEPRPGGGSPGQERAAVDAIRHVPPYDSARVTLALGILGCDTPPAAGAGPPSCRPGTTIALRPGRCVKKRAGTRRTVSGRGKVRRDALRPASGPVLFTRGLGDRGLSPLGLRTVAGHRPGLLLRRRAVRRVGRTGRRRRPGRGRPDPPPALPRLPGHPPLRQGHHRPHGGLLAVLLPVVRPARSGRRRPVGAAVGAGAGLPPAPGAGPRRAGPPADAGHGRPGHRSARRDGGGGPGWRDLGRWAEPPGPP